MGDERLSVTVLVWTREGPACAYGVVETLTTTDTLMALSEPLRPGDLFQFLLIDRTHRTSSRRFGRVTSTRHAINPDEELTAECQVQWVAAGVADEPPAAEAGKEGAA